MSEQRRKSSFEDHLNLVAGANGQTKVASAAKDGGNLLSKLAAELGYGVEKRAEGEMDLTSKKMPADATPMGANPAVVAATEQITMPQVALAGGNPAESAAGEVPAAAKQVPPSPIISSGTGDAQTAQTLNKTDEAVAAASRGAGGNQAGSLETAASSSPEKTASDAEAVRIGQIIADSFQKSLEKQAADQEYAAAVNFLDSRGALADYDLKDVPKMEKQASVGGLEKIATGKTLTRADIVSAAFELAEQEKLAADAEAEGRADARAFAELLTKVAEEAKAEAAAEAKKEGETAAEETAEEKAKRLAAMKGDSDSEKVASLMKNPAIVGAIRILKANNLM